MAVENQVSMSSAEQRDLQKLKVNVDPQSEAMLTGRQWRFQIWARYRQASFWTVVVSR